MGIYAILHLVKITYTIRRTRACKFLLEWRDVYIDWSNPCEKDFGSIRAYAIDHGICGYEPIKVRVIINDGILYSPFYHRDDASYRAKLGSLLLLLDRLEVQIYNASDGCATNALPSVPRSSLAFFRTNKKTCRDYYARIRPKIIQGARMMHDDHLMIRHIIEVSSQSSLMTMHWLFGYTRLWKNVKQGYRKMRWQWMYWVGSAS